MPDPAKFNNVVSFLWAIADLLNGAFQKSEFQKTILPFTVLRRLDYALEGTTFKPSTRLKDNPDVEKCLFVVDRKTREEFASPMTINALN